jgi:hypothetical protein
MQVPNSRARWWSILLRSIEVWLVISVVEVMHGVARTTLLSPLVGDFRARQIGVFTGSLLILSVTFLFRHWIGGVSARERLVTGAIWVLLKIVFEIVLGRAVLDLTWDRLLSDYDVARGGLMPFGLLLMLFAPLLVSLVGRKRRIVE